MGSGNEYHNRLVPSHLRARLMTPEQESRLVVAMSAANTPINRGIEEINAHLRELNGKVAAHQAKHAALDEWRVGFTNRFDSFERRSGEDRREDPPTSGENRVVTVWLVGVVIGSVSLTLAFLKLIGKL
jgi:hypothetical protein